MTLRSSRLVAGLAAAALVLTGCGSTPEPTAPTDRLKVVASTDVWGSVLSAVGGDEVEVKAIISGGGVDPHSYEATPADSAAMRDAKLVLVNGGGYDDAISKLVPQGTPVIDAVKLDEYLNAPETTDPNVDESQLEYSADRNEHVWYELDTVIKVADELVARLGDLRPAAKTKFTENATKFKEELDQIDTRLHALGEANKGARVISTEPLAVNLIDHADLKDVTPEEFAKAVEEGNDPPAAAIAELEKMITGKQAVVLIYNPQTESGVTRRIKDKALAANLPVVEMTETLPEGKNYLQWMGAQVDALAKAMPKK